MQSDVFYDAVTKESLDIILQTELIKKIKDFNREQIKLFSTQFYYFVKAFPRYLGALLWKATDDNIRYVIMDNLIDECGGIKQIETLDIEASHPALFRRLPRALGLSDQEIENSPMKNYTRQMLSNLETLFIQTPFIEAFGGIAPGVESIFYNWIGIVHEALLARNEFTFHDLIYFDIHTVVDIEHSESLKMAILPHLHCDHNKELLRRGALTMVHAQRQLFEGIMGDINNLN